MLPFLLTVTLSAAVRTPVAAVESKPHTCRVARLAEDVLCATYPVWEDRDRKAGRRIGLNIVILPALEPKHAPEPLFIFAGGPGQAATETAAGWAANRNIRAHRDIVLIDQRGTGGSNPLDCDLTGDPPNLQTVVTTQFPLAAIEACRARLSRVADLRLYTTAIAMDDIDEVRRWLGYEKIYLWGGSYGSMAAQVYLRRHGATVSAAMLAGVAPVDELVPLHHAQAGQRAVDLIFEKCLADAACKAAFPNVRAEFREVIERVRKGVDVEIHDRDGRAVRVRPSLSAFADGLRQFLYYDDGASLPLTVHRAASGDLAPLVEKAITGQLRLDAVLSMGMLLSVTCAEHLPYIDGMDLARETVNTFLGDLRVKEQRAACGVWARGAVPPDVHKLVHSDVPILLFSGQRDSVTPPSYAERVARQLPNSRHVVFPEASHGNWGPCGARIMEQFFERGSLDLDVSCLGQQAPTRFTTR